VAYCPYLSPLSSLLSLLLPYLPRNPAITTVSLRFSFLSLIMSFIQCSFCLPHSLPLSLLLDLPACLNHHGLQGLVFLVFGQIFDAVHQLHSVRDLRRGEEGSGGGREGRGRSVVMRKKKEKMKRRAREKIHEKKREGGMDTVGFGILKYPKQLAVESL